MTSGLHHHWSSMSDSNISVVSNVTFSGFLCRSPVVVLFVLVITLSFTGWLLILRFPKVLLPVACWPFICKSMIAIVAALRALWLPWAETMLLYMCFDKFLLAFESRDLSQADKSISFPNWLMSSKSSFSVSQAWGLNFLRTKFCQSSQIYLSPEKTEKTVYFLSLETFEW